MTLVSRVGAEAELLDVCHSLNEKGEGKEHGSNDLKGVERSVNGISCNIVVWPEENRDNEELKGPESHKSGPVTSAIIEALVLANLEDTVHDIN